MPGRGHRPAAQPQADQRGHAPPDRRHVDERVGVLVGGADDRRPAPAPSPSPPNSSTDTRRRSRNLTGSARTASTWAKPSTPSTTRSARSTIAARPLLGAHADADGAVEHALADQGVERVEGVEVGRVVAAVQRRARAPSARPGRAPPGPCRTRPAGAAPAPCVPSGSPGRRPRPRAASSSTRARAASSSGAPRQCSATIGPLSSIRTRSRRRSGLSRSATNCFTRPSQL